MTSTYQAPKTTWAATDGVGVNDLNRIEGNIDVLSQQGGAFGTTTNVGNAYSVTAVPAIEALVDGVLVSVKVNATNTGAITLTANGSATIAVKKGNGNDVPSGAWKQDVIYTLRYSSTANAGAGAFILQGEGGSGNAQPGHVLNGETFSNDNGDQTGSMPNQAGDVQATKVLALQNLVQNGSFENGMTGWTTASGSPATSTAGTPKYGTAYFAPTGAANVLADSHFTLSGTNHKLYISTWISLWNYTSGNAIIEVHDGNGNTIGSSDVAVNTGTWIRESFVVTNPTNSGYLRLGDWETNNNNSMGLAFDGALVIDLTVAFGAGNEPTQAQMDAIMNTLGGWFDGTSLALGIPTGAYLTNGASGVPEIVTASSDLKPSNIVSPATILGVQGSVDLSNLTPGNIKKNVTIANVTGNKLEYGPGDALPTSSTSLNMFQVITMAFSGTYLHVIGQDATYLYLGGNNYSVYRMNKSTKIIDGGWVVVLDGSAVPLACDTDSSGNIYVFGNDAYLYCFNSAKTKVWKTVCGPTGAYFWVVAVRSDAVHVLSQPGSNPTLYNVTFAGVMTQHAISSAGSNYYLYAVTQNYVYCGDFSTGSIKKYRLSDGALMKTLFGGANYGNASILYADETTDTVILVNGSIIKRTDGQAETYHTAISNYDLPFFRYNPITNKIYHITGGVVYCFDGSTGAQIYSSSGYNIGYGQCADFQATSDGNMYSNMFYVSSNYIVGLITDQITINS